ncbi:MAG: hypothetical protein KKG01_03580 [Candidatus Omnitrophica bacterium]|nr:hypothetical protein [Candidatus Omnitrophota bacterium]MBU4589984.1 hypothetical protein [Candidatus Omnitrophota bacterium]
MDWNAVVMEPVTAMLARVAGFLPTLLGVLVILIIGWIIAGMLKNVVVKLLKLIQLDTATEKAGLGDILRRGGIRQTLSELIGVLIYWLIMLMVFMTALNALGMTVAASLLDKVIMYIPNVIAAMFILSLGIFFSSMIGTIVRTASSNAGITQAKFLGQLTQTVIMIFAIMITLEQLNIASSVLNLAINIILASIGLAVAIAVGLGSKDLAGKMMGDFVSKLKGK